MRGVGLFTFYCTPLPPRPSNPFLCWSPAAVACSTLRVARTVKVRCDRCAILDAIGSEARDGSHNYHYQTRARAAHSRTKRTCKYVVPGGMVALSYYSTPRQGRPAAAPKRPTDGRNCVLFCSPRKECHYYRLATVRPEVPFFPSS